MREKRQHQRTSFVAPVEVRLPSGETIATQSHDLSLGGMFLEGGPTPPIGTVVSLTLDLPGLPGSTLPAYVRWMKDGGFGVQFGLLGARETHAVGKIVRQGAS